MTTMDHTNVLTAERSVPDIRLSAVVLAAGMSARMGESPKLLLDVGGMPMVRRTVTNVLSFAPVETVVVTGHRAAEIEAALAGLPVTFVRNDAHRQGQPTSVAAGVRGLTAHCHAVMIVLGDQPLLTADHLRSVAKAYRQLDRSSIRGSPPQRQARQSHRLCSAAYPRRGQRRNQHGLPTPDRDAWRRCRADGVRERRLHDRLRHA